MTEAKKKLYEPPVGKPLTASSVVGQGPEGQCMNGAFPFTDCVAGPNFVPIADCVSFGLGVDTSSCSAGTFHAYPTCRAGSSAATICISGANQN